MLAGCLLTFRGCRGYLEISDFTINRMGFGAMRSRPATGHRGCRSAYCAGPSSSASPHRHRRFLRSPVARSGRRRDCPLRQQLIREALSPYPEELVITTQGRPWRDDAGNSTTRPTAAGLRTHGRTEPPPAGQGPPRRGQPRDPSRSPRRTRSPSGSCPRRTPRPGADPAARHLNSGRTTSDEAQAIAPVVACRTPTPSTPREDDEFLKICGQRGVASCRLRDRRFRSRRWRHGTDHSKALQALAEGQRRVEQQLRLSGPSTGHARPRHSRHRRPATWRRTSAAGASSSPQKNSPASADDSG